jgi:hypothetical protein
MVCGCLESGVPTDKVTKLGAWQALKDQKANNTSRRGESRLLTRLCSEGFDVNSRVSSFRFVPDSKFKKLQ